jgi:hypothetical protein
MKRHNIQVRYNKPVFREIKKDFKDFKDIKNIENEDEDKEDDYKYNDKMTIVLSFVGKLPSYTNECLHQIRLFFDGDIYLITDDSYNSYESYLKYNINIVSYDEVKDDKLLYTSKKYNRKFTSVLGLKGREELFLRSLERFFLLRNLMKKRKLKNCFFMEIDNLIYDDPNKWLSNFSKNELAYMFDNHARYSSGVMYVKAWKSMEEFLDMIIKYISTDNGFINEMTFLSLYLRQYSDKVQILPTYYTHKKYNETMHKEYNNYHSIFDAAAIGCYLAGIDPYHTSGKIVLHQRWVYSQIDCTKEKFQWIRDEKGRNRPYIFNDEKNEWILINNLHVHSKDLKSVLSL